MALYDVGKKMDELALMEGLVDHELGIGSLQEHFRIIFVPFVGAREGRSTLNICHLISQSFRCSPKHIFLYSRDANSLS